MEHDYQRQYGVTVAKSDYVSLGRMFNQRLHGNGSLYNSNVQVRRLQSNVSVKRAYFAEFQTMNNIIQVSHDDHDGQTGRSIGRGFNGP